jgi:hypothetical protein
MSLDRLLTIPATVVTRTPSGTDDYGTVIYTDTTTATTCWLDQTLRRERTEDEVDVERYRAYFRAGVALASRSKVTAVGLTYEVDGPPWEVIDPRTGAVDHIEATLIRTT